MEGMLQVITLFAIVVSSSEVQKVVWKNFHPAAQAHCKAVFDT
jgi:hypothetical protein